MSLILFPIQIVVNDSGSKNSLFYAFDSLSTNRLKIKPNSVRIIFLSCQICVLPSTGFELTPLIHCSTNRLALCPAPQTTRPHPLHKKWSFNSRSVTLSRKENLEIDIRHVSKRIQMVHIYLYYNDSNLTQQFLIYCIG